MLTVPSAHTSSPASSSCFPHGIGILVWVPAQSGFLLQLRGFGSIDQLHSWVPPASPISSAQNIVPVGADGILAGKGEAAGVH